MPTTEDLDIIYGPCREAGRPVQPHEVDEQPISLTKLTDANAYLLGDYMEGVEGFSVTDAFAKAYHLLWLIDEVGDLFVACEELIDNDGNLVGVLPKNIAARPPNFIKLGHPSLLPPGMTSARIGGELVYDPDGDTTWCLTNSSGRYGLRPWQREFHLENARRIFHSLGLYMTYQFIAPIAQG